MSDEADITDAALWAGVSLVDRLRREAEWHDHLSMALAADRIEELESLLADLQRHIPAPPGAIHPLEAASTPIPQSVHSAEGHQVPGTCTGCGQVMDGEGFPGATR